MRGFAHGPAGGRDVLSGAGHATTVHWLRSVAKHDGRGTEWESWVGLLP